MNKTPERSKTVLGFLLLLIASMPGLADPIWGVLATAGVSPEWVARAQAVVYVLGAVGVIWGRATASGPLRLWGQGQ